MPKRCPPGVLCIENVTIMFICIILLIVGGGVYLYRTKHQALQNQAQQQAQQHRPGLGHMQWQPQMKGRGDDVFFDIYKPPLRDERCFMNVGGNVPINVPTQGCADAPYRQVGILTRYGGKDETILPLMGRPLFKARDKWNFYTLNDKNNMIKLPVKVKGKSGTSEYGVDNLYGGDLVFVEGYNEAFKVTTYENDVMRYLPSL
jgi:hypothetical protein